MLRVAKVDDPKEKTGSTRIFFQNIPVHVTGVGTATSTINATATSTINELGKRLLKAAGEGNINEIRWFLSKGATFTADWLGTSPLHLAAQNNHLEVCELLLRAGISKDARTKVDKTPLHMAAYEGHNDILEVLLKHGADVDARDMLGMTPLHWACQNGHVDVVATLIRHSCQLDIPNKFDLTPIDIALQTKRHDIVELITIGLRDPLTATESLAIELGSTDNSNESCTQAAAAACMNVEQDPQDPVMVESIPIETALMEEIDHTNEFEEEVTSSQTANSESEDVIMGETFQPINENDEAFSESIKLLQEHGITMLPADDSNILASVVENGHSVVLTDVGKEMLNTVKQQEQATKPTMVTSTPIIHKTVPNIENRKIITLTPDEFIAFTNGTLSRDNLLSKMNRKVVPKTFKRVVMKKNKIIPVSSVTNSAIQSQVLHLKDNSDMETVMRQLVEAKKTIEEYKVKLQKKELEAERYKQQLKLLLESS